MLINMSKNFISTSESKIYVEYNQLSIEEQEKKELGILFIPPNPQWKGAGDNVIMNDIFYKLEKEYAVMKSVFQDYKSDLYNNKSDLPNIQYVRDASVVVDYFFSRFSCVKRFTVIGYSWGCSVLLNLIMRRPEISNFIFISPTLTLKGCDWTTYVSTFRTNGMIIHGTEDQITNVETVEKYVKFLESKKMVINFKTIQGADHYYKNHKEELFETIYNFVKDAKNCIF